MAVTAEGVEREVQRSLLQRAGCNEVQGFLFSKAVSEEQLTRMLSHPS
jgi:EAL domain-containing protein (putative c-di-GMP-specific phosphodiesterase class I)